MLVDRRLHRLLIMTLFVVTVLLFQMNTKTVQAAIEGQKFTVDGIRYQIEELPYTIEGTTVHVKGSVSVLGFANSPKNQAIIPDSYVHFDGDYYQPIWISYGAFADSNITRAYIGQYARVVGAGAYHGCKDITELSFAKNNMSSLVSIWESAFEESGITSVILPDTVVTIEKNVFKNCDNLINVKIGAAAETIGSSTFAECDFLTSVVISDAYEYPGKKDAPPKLSIGSEAFKSCNNLRSVVIPSRVKSIADDAFSDCPDLIIYGKSDSYAETYAKKNKITFKSLSQVKEYYSVAYSSYNCGGNAPRDTNVYADGDKVKILDNFGLLYKGDNDYLLCWNTAKNGTGTDYYPGKEYAINSVLVLYPKWTQDVSVDDIVVSPSKETVLRGNSCQFSAKVKGSGSPMQDVVWSSSDYFSKIDSLGNIIVADGQNATTITVKAISIRNPKKFGTATITVPRDFVDHVSICGHWGANLNTTLYCGDSETVVVNVFLKGQTWTGSDYDGHWQISGNNSPNTKLDNMNSTETTLRIGMDETASTITLTGISNLEPTKKGTVTFTILHPSIKIDTITSKEYTGNEIVPNVVVRDENGKALVKDTDYTLSFVNNIDVGTATVNVIGKGKYKEVKAFTSFDITPKYAYITFIAGNHGRINGYTTARLISGSYAGTIPTVIPDTGYRFIYWSCDSGITRLTREEFATKPVTGNITYTAYYDAPQTSILVSSYTGETTITEGKTLQMTATVSPVYATNQKITWSIVSGSGASISNSGVLLANTSGTVRVRATAADGSGVYGEKIVKVNANIPPVRKSGVPATSDENIKVNTPYGINLSTIFEDAEHTPLTYKVSINNGPEYAAAEDFSYTPSLSGTITLRFKANDIRTDSMDTYTVTLHMLPPSINAGTVTYDLNNPGDVSTTINWNSAGSVTDVLYGTQHLTAPNMYSVNGNKLLINRNYLQQKDFSKNDHAVYVIYFNSGDSINLNLDIIDSYIPSNDATLNDLKLGSNTVNGFNTNIYDYNVTLPYGTLPGDATATVGATSNDTKANVSITQASIFPGSATVRVTSEDLAVIKTYTLHFAVEAPPIIPLTSITVNGPIGETVISKGSTMQMAAVISPANATNPNVIWSIVSGSGASIDSSGLLTASASGIVIVRATAANGSGIYGEIHITISNTLPSRKIAVPVAMDKNITVNTTYNLHLSTIFEDTNHDSLTYKVSINNDTEIIADENFTYTLSVAGTTTLRFKANDGTADSTDTYTVTLTTSNIDITPPSISPDVVTYDQNNPGDVSTTINWNSAGSVTDVLYGTKSLKAANWYSLIGSNLTISHIFILMNDFTEGDHVVLTIIFNTGDTINLNLDIIDSYNPD